MAENINLDVDAVLKTLIGQRATNPQAQAVINDFLRLVLNRETFTSSDLQTALQAQLQPINDQLGAIMATMGQFQQALSRIDTATSAAAQVLTEVRAKVAELETNAGISASDEASVLGQLDAAANALEQMGKSPENPVPVDPGTPTEPTNPTPTEPANPTPGEPVA